MVHKNRYIAKPAPIRFVLAPGIGMANQSDMLTKYRYLTPFPMRVTSQRMAKYFKGKYEKASASYYFNGRFYLKFNEQWNENNKNFDIENFNYTGLAGRPRRGWIGRE